jgi:pseudaminic acid biosynthesis-associated methylase
MNEQAKWWAGQAGEAYTARNRVDWMARRGFWIDIIDMTGTRSAYEVGTNAGWNLSAIQNQQKPVAVYGCDVNPIAVGQARAAGLDVFQGDAITALANFPQPTFDLVFTAGVLIHIPPQTLPIVMHSIVNASAQYVLAVEYEGDETMVEYRGESDRLWRRHYGSLYEGMGLKLVDSGQVGPADGFDNCTWWLLQK